jgi:Ca-activated chloride channel family protein
MRNELSNALRLCFATVLFLATAAAAWAQEEEPLTVQVVQVDESRFPEIDVYASVTDADGRPVTDLKLEDFRLEENDQRIKTGPSGFSQAGEQGPVTAVLAIDKSGSMIEGKMEAAREAAIAFVELMREGDATGVIAFDTEVTNVQPLTEDKDTLVEAISAIEMGSDTALYDALHAASEMLESVSGRKAIIAVTDGMNTAGQHTLEETMELVGGQGVSVYAIGLGDPAKGTAEYAGIDEEMLQAIAEESNGTYHYAPEPEDLSDLYESLSFRLQNEYKLTYRSPVQLRDGVKRNVVVTVAGSAGRAEVTASYNPGGVIPEVEPRPTWLLFGAMFVLLAALLLLPGLARKAVALVAGGGSGPSKGKTAGQGRVRLTGESRAAGRKKR